MKNTMLTIVSPKHAIYAATVFMMTGFCIGSETESAPRYVSVPDYVSGVSRHIIDLGGTWQFKSSADGEAESGPITVPGQWVQQGYTVSKGNFAEYKRSMTVPGEWKGLCIVLRCDAIYSESTIFINGEKVGSHLGGFTPFEFDVTGMLKYGADNEIRILVSGHSEADKLASGIYYAGHDTGGIIRKIRLLAVAPVHTALMQVRTDLDPECKNAELVIDMQFGSMGKPGQSEIEFALSDPDGKAVKLSKAKQRLDASTLKAGGSYSFDIANIRTWDAEDPELYELTCAITLDGDVVQKVSEKIGFRKVEVRGVEVLVNNMPVKLRGACRHEAHPLTGRSITAELCRKDAEMFKAANMDFIRTSHYPPSEEFLDACDELGLFVEVEMPLCWVKKEEYAREHIDYLMQVSRQTVRFFYNHPCIIMWSGANESYWNDSFVAQAAEIKSMDSSRLTIFHSHQDRGPRPDCDLDNKHYPGVIGQNYGKMVDEAKKPVLFGEYAHIGRCNHREKITDPGILDIYDKDIDLMWNAMYRQKGILGGAIWAAIDDTFMMGRIPTGHGNWGVIDGWRREKPETWHVTKTYSPVRILKKFVTVSSDDKQVNVSVENRFNFTDFSDLDIRWTADGKSGKAQSSIPPHSEGKVSVDYPASKLIGKSLHLEFVDAHGRVIDSFKLAITDDPDSYRKTPPRPKAEAAQKPSFSRKGDSVIIADKSKKGRIQWILDAATGFLTEVRYKDSIIICGGPYLEITPLHPKNHRLIVADFEKVSAPYQVYGVDWELTGLDMAAQDDHIAVTVSGKYDVGAVTYVYRFYGGGQLEIEYSVEPVKVIHARVWGLAFDLPGSHHELSWDRNAYWTVYPEHHIGRPSGTAVAFPEGANCDTLDFDKLLVYPPINPKWPWGLDASVLGCNDFRATKHNIYSASLSDPDGAGLTVRSNGTQHFKADVRGDKVRAHVSEFSGIGQRRRSGQVRVKLRKDTPIGSKVFVTIGER